MTNQVEKSNLHIMKLWIAGFTALFVLASCLFLRSTIKIGDICSQQPIAISDVAADDLNRIISEPIPRDNGQLQVIDVSEGQVSSYLTRTIQNNYLESEYIFFDKDTVCFVGKFSQKNKLGKMNVNIQARATITTNASGDLIVQINEVTIGPLYAPTNLLEYLSSIVNSTLHTSLANLDIHDVKIGEGHFIISFYGR